MFLVKSIIVIEHHLSNFLSNELRHCQSRVAVTLTDVTDTWCKWINGRLTERPTDWLTKQPQIWSSDWLLIDCQLKQTVFPHCNGRMRDTGVKKKKSHTAVSWGEKWRDIGEEKNIEGDYGTKIEKISVSQERQKGGIRKCSCGKVFSAAGYRSNSLYFPLGNKIMDCVCGLFLECVCVHFYLYLCSKWTPFHLLVFVSVSMSPLARVERMRTIEFCCGATVRIGPLMLH